MQLRCVYMDMLNRFVVCVNMLSDCVCLGRRGHDSRSVLSIWRCLKTFLPTSLLLSCNTRPTGKQCDICHLCDLTGMAGT